MGSMIHSCPSLSAERTFPFGGPPGVLAALAARRWRAGEASEDGPGGPRPEIARDECRAPVGSGRLSTEITRAASQARSLDRWVGRSLVLVSEPPPGISQTQKNKVVGRAWPPHLLEETPGPGPGPDPGTLVRDAGEGVDGLDAGRWTLAAARSLRTTRRRRPSWIMELQGTLAGSWQLARWTRSHPRILNPSAMPSLPDRIGQFLEHDPAQAPLGAHARASALCVVSRVA